MSLNWTLEGPAGAPVVLVSAGLGGAAAYWAPQAPALAGHRVLAFDHRGTGRNAGGLPPGYSVPDMADEALAVMDAAGVDRCLVLGHALGGLVGLSMALKAPPRIDGLALVNAWAAPNPHTERCFAARTRLLAQGGPRAYVEAQPIFLYPAAWAMANDERVAAEVEHGVAHFQGEANLLKRIRALLTFDVAQHLPRLDLPVWLLAAEDDTLVPWTCSQALADALPRATLHRLPQGGHAVNVTQADAFNQALWAFLQATRSAS
ncbi:pyrimidine utilization protein D [Aquabacterium sp. J223]|uniref:pyrimidine utilization protein D n=1 Tax=Aquabacterium sp. J223 TaxID=2898431 RepID=UPI0021ADE11E|nr:pyrimidine utilization protein D [Aquabacterium sp. J223]UUX94431.1 pyrimidine utilization protein D [Aquabacterium sp. J223]